MFNCLVMYCKELFDGIFSIFEKILQFFKDTLQNLPNAAKIVKFLEKLSLILKTVAKLANSFVTVKNL